LLRRVAGSRHIPFVMVEGNAELTPARLIGHFDPALVLSKGYVPEIFADGPLLEALRTGALLYVEELNRIPEETLNVLLTAMSELEITVPRLGRVAAEPGFALVAAMNPFDAVGTARVSGALYDRTCRIAMDYQSAQAEQSIVALRADDDVDAGWRAQVVDLVRRTREHPDIRFGSSVRGAIDVTKLAVQLARLRGVPTGDWHVGLAAAKAALSGRIRLQDGGDRTPEQVVTELYVAVFGAEPTGDQDDDADAPQGSPGER
jgi:MoxR-like ATPase